MNISRAANYTAQQHLLYCIDLLIAQCTQTTLYHDSYATTHKTCVWV